MDSVAEFLIALPLWALFALALAQNGRLLFSSLGYPFGDPLEELSFSFALGTALFATAIWGLGLASSLNVWSVGALSFAVIAVWVFTLRSFFAWLPGLGQKLKNLFKSHDRPQLFFAFLAFACFLATLAATASPQLGRDALAYHFYCPKEFIQHGRMFGIPYSVNAFQPLLIEMLYLQGLLFKSEILGKLYNIGFLLGTACAMAAAARLFEARSKGAVPGLLLFLCVGFMAQTPYAYTDIALSFFLFLSFFSLWRYFREPKPVFIAVSGVFSGFALAVKLLALPVVTAYFLLLFWHLFSTRQEKKWRPILTFALFILLPCAGWYLRSWVYTGNPIYPNYNQVFTGHPWASDIRDQTGIGRSFGAFVKAPLFFFIDPKSFGGGDSQIGVLILLLAPILFRGLVAADRNRLLFLTLFQGLFCFFMVQHYRFIFPLFPVLYLFGGVALEKLFAERGRSRIPYKAALAAAILLQAAFVFYYNGKLARFVSYDSRDAYLIATERSYASAAWVNAHLPNDAQLLLFNEPSQYYFDRHAAREDIVLGLEPELAMKDAGDLLGEMRARGFTHLITRQSPEAAESTLITPGTSGRFKLLHEEKFSYGRERSLIRVYELVHD